MQNQPAGQGGEDGFQAHQQGGHSGLRIPLAQDLQGVGHAAGQNACVENGPLGVQNGREGGRFKEKGGNQPHQPGGEKLDAGHFDAVYLGREMVDDNNVDGEEEGADQHQQVP